MGQAKINHCLALILAGAALATLAGCAIPMQTNQAIGVPSYPPTDPLTVQVLQTPPTAKYITLGNINLQPAEGVPVSKIQAKIQQAAAKLGANAAIIVVDRTAVLGATITGGWY